MGLLSCLSELIYMKYLEWCLVSIEYSVNVNYHYDYILYTFTYFISFDLGEG